ncbi:MAG: C39 family peptidase [Polyangiaceae bacterium]|nr:C39 family peptidase [Polyangiaceae bacterium]
MESKLEFDILPQPDEGTCGPTCLHSVYQYYGEQISLKSVIRTTPRLRSGGTLAVFLAGHALRRGYRALMFTYNLQMFDPTWFPFRRHVLRRKLAEQARHRTGRRLHRATAGYVDFLDQGGELRLEDLTAGLIRKYLRRGVPILTGLSATYLYRTAREFGPRADYDDIRGKASGHFVVLCGYDRKERSVLVADPLLPNPIFDTRQKYKVPIDRVVGAILLGILTYDANLLIIEPRSGAKKGTRHADSHRR